MRDAGAAAFVQRVAVVRIVDDPAVGVDVGAPVQIDRLGGRWVQGIDTVPRILDARNRPRAHSRALEPEDTHEYRRAGLGDDGLHERVITRIEAAEGRMIDGDVRTIGAVREPVRGGRRDRRRVDVRVPHRISQQLLRSRQGRAVGAAQHAAPVVEEEPRIGGQANQGAHAEQGDGHHRQDLARLAVPPVASPGSRGDHACWAPSETLHMNRDLYDATRHAVKLKLQFRSTGRGVGASTRASSPLPWWIRP